MRYPPHLLEEIRARLPVSAVVGRKVRLKKAGREWRGLSPFNAEKTPSFYANDQKAFYHCFSSGKHGDIFTFLMETEGLSFPEAVERLAAEAGVDLPKVSPEIEREVERRRDLTEVLDLAARFFESKLANAAGEEARAYLARRQISPATQAEFRIGFAPDSRNALLEHLRAKGVSDELILRAGLAIAPEGGGSLYDRFRGRIVFPIQDLSGRVVAFGGRGMSEAVVPKYLNSPETEVFQKGHVVFNGHRARAVAQKDQALAVVEGYLDAIAVWQAGHKSVVATLGTAFTEEQIKSLWRIDPEPVLCFDGDRAGRTAAFRAVDRMTPFLEVGKTFRFAFLPEGQDPDDVVRVGGITAFGKHLAEAQTFWDVLWRREMMSVDTATPDGIALLNANLRRLVGQIGDTQLRYRYELTVRISVNELAYRETRRHFTQTRTDASSLTLLRTSPLVAGGMPEGIATERIFLGLCVAFPDFVSLRMEDIEKITFEGTHKTEQGEIQPFQVFVNELCRLINEEEIESTELIYSNINPVFFSILEIVHGGSADTAWFGFSLARNFPSYGYITDSIYFSRCFRLFIDKLMAREILKHINGISADEIEDAERKFYLKSELLTLIESIKVEDLELAEIASTYRPRRAAA